jgi:hypothetical protein
MRLAWLNSETIKTMLTVIAIPLALAYLSHRYEETTAKNQAADARLRLYTELLTSREQADSGLRKDMFGKVLDTFMTKRDGDVDQQLVELELLAANFQDSLNLSPLFRQLRRQINARVKAGDWTGVRIRAPGERCGRFMILPPEWMPRSARAFLRKALAAEHRRVRVSR